LAFSDKVKSELVVEGIGNPLLTADIAFESKIENPKLIE
jgi:hypothetical protein